MLDKPKYIDPRSKSVADAVLEVLPQIAPHGLRREVISLLAGERDIGALRVLASLLPGRNGVSYRPEDIQQRSGHRINAAMKKSVAFSSRPFRVVLDVGCGRAENYASLIELGAERYVGLDVSSRHFPATENRMTLIEASAESMPLESESVDFAVSFNVFEHIPDPAKALSEVMRVLRPGGVFYTKFGPPFNGAGGPHLSRFIDLPFLHHLFPEDVVAEFVGRSDAYYTVNRHPLEYYRETLFREDSFSLPFYREQINTNGLWMLNLMPELIENVGIEELAVCAIVLVAVKH